MTRTGLPFFPILAVLALLALVPAAPAAAQGGSGSGSFELYGGIFDPDTSESTTYGLRGGYRMSDRFAVELTAGRVDELEGFDLAELSLKTYLGSATGNAQLFLFAGPGWANLDFGFFEIDTLTANVGVGADLYLGRNVYLRPDVRWRWFEDFDDSEVEATLALGFSFGR